MRRRREPEDALGREQPPGGPEPAGEEAPPNAAASSFEAAQAMLRAALEELRASDTAQARSPWEESDDDTGAATVHALRRRRRPAASAAPTVGSVDQPASSSGRSGPSGGVRRTRARRPAPAPPPTSGSDDLAEDGCFIESPRSTRPRRRTRAHGEPPILDAHTGLPEHPVGLPPESQVATQSEAPPRPSADEPAPLPDLAFEEPVPPGDRVPAASRRRTRYVVGAAVGVAAVALAALAGVLSTGGSDGQPALRTAPPRARLTFDPVTTPDGVTVTRVWELRGPRGARFVGTLSFANPGSAPRETTFTEVIPKSLASSVRDITFAPVPFVVQDDPVVRYSVNVPGNGDLRVRYEIEVAPEGARRARLEAWAEDLPAEPAPTTTTTPPATAAPVPEPTAPPVTTPARPRTTTAPAPPPTEPPPPAATGVLIVRVVSQGDIGTFGFSWPEGSLVLTTSTPSGSPSGFAQVGRTAPVGTYQVTSAGAAGWTLQGIACNDGDSGGSGSTATYSIQADETVVCTFSYAKA